MESLVKKRLLFLLKIAISIVILYFIFRNLDMKVVVENFMKFSFLTLLVLLSTTCVKLYLQYKNWKMMLHLNPDFSSRRRQIFKSYLIGLALGFLIPGGHASFGKVFFIENTSKRRTFFSILMEKFFLTWTNWFFAIWATLFYFYQVSLVLKITGGVIVTFLPVFLYYGMKLRPSLEPLRQEFRKAAPYVMLNQIETVFFTFIQYWIILNTFYPIRFDKVAISSSLVLFANTIPITFSGLGLRETFAVHIFKRYGIRGEYAVTASLTIFFITGVLPALVGLFLMLREKKKHPRDASFKEMLS